MIEPLSKLADVHYGKSPANVADKDAGIPLFGTGGVYGKTNRALFDGPAVVVPRKGSLGSPHFTEGPFWASDTTYAVIPKNDVDAKWLYYSLAEFDLSRLNEATGVPSISREWLRRIRIHTPVPEEQKRVAEALSNADQTIDRTQDLIAKHQRIKAGMMQDLFTRGLLPNGDLRPAREDAPTLYQQSALGITPVQWATETIDVISESLTDGPFGSNLKTEHYVPKEGVRVVRLQNIREGVYNDKDRAFISPMHAQYLSRHRVTSGDILIAGLGEDNNPVARSCCYPNCLPDAINKADCLRMRCKSGVALNEYVMNFLNTAAARSQVRRFEQGVTRRRINGGNLRRLLVPLPPLTEQAQIVERLAIVSSDIENTEILLGKMQMLKQGLMQDLLGDRIPVSTIRAAATTA